MRYNKTYANRFMPSLPQGILSAKRQHTQTAGPLQPVPSLLQTPATGPHVLPMSLGYGRRFLQDGQEISSLPPFARGALTMKINHPKPHSKVATHATKLPIFASRTHAGVPDLIVHTSGAVFVPAPVHRLSYNHCCPKECN
jgi:hypothetical protein